MDEKPDEAKVERMTWTDDDVSVSASVPPETADEAFVARGVTASGAVTAREGLPNRLQRPDRAIARLLGDDGLGKAFDALVASGTMSQPDLLATAVERSHEYYSIPAVLASGEARTWAHSLSDQAANDMLYSEAAEEFEKAQAQTVVASARTNLRKRVLRGRIGRG